jgi:hypothetical protein
MPKGTNYSSEELNNFLDLVDEILPISATQWDRAAEQHLLRYPDKGQSVDSLKHKFKELHLKRIPTGDPNCPPAVRRAKRLRRAIINLMDGSDMNSQLREDNGDDDESTSKSSSSGGDEFHPGDIHFDDNVGEDENTDDVNGGGGVRPASRVSGTAAAACPASRASLTDADTRSSSRPSGTAAGSDGPIRGEGEDEPVSAGRAQQPPYPQELEEAGEDHPHCRLFLSALPLTLPQFLGPEIEIASMKICLRDQATTLAMWWQ